MEKAKQAISSFLSKDGKHDTTVHETVSPAVTNEKVFRTEHIESQTLIDREVHQDHHHISVQPITHKEVLPEEHKHNLVAVEHRKIDHGNPTATASKLEQEKAQFKNTREVGNVVHTTGTAGAVVGEHVHHHVYEHIQPVIQKETIQHSVLHTTVPVHEVHSNAPKHHTATQLPAVTLDEFTRQGGKIGGREERSDAFMGEPRSVNPLGGTSLGGKGANGASFTEDVHNGQHGKFGSTGANGIHNTNTGTYGTAGVGTNGVVVGTKGAGTNGIHDTPRTSEVSGTKRKSSLLNKLNPKTDADRDGKSGFLK